MRLLSLLTGRSRPKLPKAKARNIWLFLFGEIGDQLAAILPGPEAFATATWLPPATNGKEDKLRCLRPLVVTDRPATADWLRQQGHRAIDLSGHDLVPHDDMADHAMRRLAQALEAFSPAALLFTPEFALRFQRPLDLVAALRAALRSGARAAGADTLNLLTTDVDTEIHNIVDIARKLKAGGRKGLAVRLLHYGSSQMYDYHRRLSFHEPRTVESLGWHLSETLMPRAGDAPGRQAFVWLRRPLARRDLLADLLPARAALGLDKIVVLGEPHVTLPASPHVEYVSSAGPFLRRALMQGAITIADGDALLFPLLQSNLPAVLLESASQSKPALIRCAYFTGQNRLPVFEHERDLMSALRTAGSIQSFWHTWSDRRCSIEKEPPFLFQNALIDALRGMAAATDAARTEPTVPA